jgi:putative transposase
MFIKEHRKQYPLSLLCEVLQVSPSGYHKWLRRKISLRTIEKSTNTWND